MRRAMVWAAAFCAAAMLTVLPATPAAAQDGAASTPAETGSGRGGLDPDGPGGRVTGSFAAPDAITGEQLNFDIGERSLAGLQPGDQVQINGAPHTLRSLRGQPGAQGVAGPMVMIFDPVSGAEDRQRAAGHSLLVSDQILESILHNLGRSGPTNPATESES